MINLQRAEFKDTPKNQIEEKKQQARPLYNMLLMR